MFEAHARDIMTRQVHSVTPEMSVRDFAHFLLDKHISGAPVLDPEGRMLGIATESDLIVRDAAMHLPTVVTLFDSVIYLESPRKFQQELHKIIGGNVSDIMSHEVVTIGPEATLREMATLMRERKRHLLPVLEEGKLVGIVGKADLVRAIAQEEG
jgi:CBS domain-containing protein